MITYSWEEACCRNVVLFWKSNCFCYDFLSWIRRIVVVTLSNLPIVLQNLVGNAALCSEWCEFLYTWCSPCLW